MAFELKTLSDIHASVFEKSQLNESSTAASNLVTRLINERYVDISQLCRWRWLQSTSSTVVPAMYNTGSVTISNASATAVGSGVNFTASMVGRKLHLESENDVYTIASRTSATRVILDASYRGTAISGGSFRIYRNNYTLPVDCEELIDVYYFPLNGGRLRTLAPINQRQMLNVRLGTRISQGKAEGFSHGNQTSSGTRVLEIWPPADTVDYRIRFDYSKKVTSLSATSDQPLMPVTYRSSIMWGALADLFMREGNTTRMEWAERKMRDKVNEMRKDWETTDRRPTLKYVHTQLRSTRPSGARYDLGGAAFDYDTFEND